ncbi:MAG: AAA domain-containing protein, partial [Planctomycetota bacterium]
KQLPPTNFFARQTGDEDLPEDAVEDLESILDECIAAGVPVRRLAWHYRSKHESLIAFSNARYYGGDLVTFPSSGVERGGVSVRFVEDGCYEKGTTRTNPREAEAVVAEIVRRIEDPAESNSIGVVTFNQAQQTRILDALEDAQRERPELESALALDAPDGVFVKNLENVQGDERDTIVFSIGYGPDDRGRVSMNFGPLNKDGGERRLNVAITRARAEVVVFTSLRSDQIDLGRTSARGVADLRAFLAFAERGERGGDADAQTVDPSRQRDVLVAAIARGLRARGHDVRIDVGASEVRVDIGVVDPNASSAALRFALGIETDGLNYARAATSRDRDRLRSDVLTGLGWRLHRVWAVDWWRDPDVELDRIEAALRGE